MADVSRRMSILLSQETPRSLSALRNIPRHATYTPSTHRNRDQPIWQREYHRARRRFT